MSDTDNFEEKFMKNFQLFQDKFLKVLTELNVLRNERKTLQKNCFEKETEIGDLKRQLQNVMRESDEQKQKLDVVLNMVKRMETDSINNGAETKELCLFNLDAVTRERDRYKQELDKLEILNHELTRDNVQHLDAIKSLQQTIQLTIDEKAKIRHEIIATQKDLQQTATNYKAIQCAFGKIEKIVNSSVTAINYYKSSYDRIETELQKATKQIAIYQAQRNTNSSSSTCTNQLRISDQSNLVAEIQQKYEKLLSERNAEKQQINEFMEKTLSISSKTILDLTTELNEIKENLLNQQDANETI